MSTTLPKAMLATLAIAHLSNPLATTIAYNPLEEHVTTATIIEKFTPEYRLSGADDNGKLVEVIMLESTQAMTNEVLSMSELLGIGAILFKDSRDIVEDEAEMMRAYLANKYTAA
jgi:hypothetical protein